jgi:hypothetical protein
MDELCVALIMIYQRFTFQVRPPTLIPLKLLARNTLIAKGGIHCTAHRRNTHSPTTSVPST